MSQEIKIPYNFTPRPYQLPVFKAVLNGPKTKHLMMFSRRTGKTLTLLHILAVAMMRKVGNYLIVLPEYSQARKAIWDNVTNDGELMIDAAFPSFIVAKKNNTTMSITLINGSRLLIVGADKPSSLVGGNYTGIVFDECGIVKADALNYLRPILAARNDTWLLLSSTPRFGHWFTEMYLEESAIGEDSNYSIHVCPALESGVFTQETLDLELAELIKVNGPEDGLAIFKTEYNLDITASNAGSFYGSILANNEDKFIEMSPDNVMYAAWDLGMNDSTVITIFSKLDSAIRVHKVISGSGRTVQDYWLKDLSKMPFKIHIHFLPHDGSQKRGYTTKVSAKDALMSFGQRVKMIPKSSSVLNDINAVREALPNVWFNETDDVKQMRDKLKAYSKKLNNGVVTGHDHCDFADSFRYMVLSTKLINDRVNENVNKSKSYYGVDNWMV